MIRDHAKKFISDAVFILLSLVLAIGVATVFKPCGPKDDGGFMTCHWAGLVVVAIGIVLTVQGIVRLFTFEPNARRGISIASLATAVLAIAVPDKLVKICGMSSMQCQLVTKPVVTVISILIIVALIVDIVLSSKDISREKKK